VSIAVVAHTSRIQQAEHLADTVDAQYIAVDDGTLGCERNHLRCWTWLRDHNTTPWSIVLEDDAQPVTDFTTQVEAALAVAPTPIVSLYLGTSRPAPWQPRINTAITAANDTDAHWILGSQMLHAVGIAIRTDLLADLCGWLARTQCPIDQAIGAFAVTQQQRIAYTWPSLVDHLDHDTIATHRDRTPRTEPRKAWTVGSRTTWNHRTITM
jgi:GR25 family glycosyltransferase involved in LPS biosynthesis